MRSDFSLNNTLFVRREDLQSELMRMTKGNPEINESTMSLCNESSRKCWRKGVGHNVNVLYPSPPLYLMVL